MRASIFEVLFLVTALSADAFAAGFAYGVSKIKLPLASLFVLSGISSLTLLASLLAGRLAGSFFPDSLTRGISFLFLFILGIVKLFEGFGQGRAEEADRNKDAVISLEEAVALGAALSIDSITAGVGAGIGSNHIFWVFGASFLTGVLAVKLGGLLGRLAASRFRIHLSWVSGLLLLILAFMKIL